MELMVVGVIFVFLVMMVVFMMDVLGMRVCNFFWISENNRDMGEIKGEFCKFCLYFK